MILLCVTTATKEHSVDKMRVLVIFGSPHSNGPSAQLLQALLNSLPDNAVISRFDCFKRAPLPCTDCRACFVDNRCILTDIDDFYQNLKNADALIFVSPVYNLSFPAPMKALIDRMQCYWAARFKRGIRPPIAKPKTAVLITACGNDSIKGGQFLEHQLKPVLTLLNAQLIKTVHYFGSDKNRPIEPFLKKAADAAGQL